MLLYRDQLDQLDQQVARVMVSECRPVLLDDLPRYKRVLLLQGPVGPFFDKLAAYWHACGTEVCKINFNAGDETFYSFEASSFKQPLIEWPAFLFDYLKSHQIEAVFLFGDCRPIHMPVGGICATTGIDVWVFEEGYVRPNYLTLEKGGVNYRSTLTRTSPPEHTSVLKTQLTKFPYRFWYMCWWGFRYWLSCTINKSEYPLYTHHRELNLHKAFCWTRSFYRYWIYQLSESKIRHSIIKSKEKKFFVAPLQVHDDSQITHHSDYKDIEYFIEEVMESFAKQVKQDPSFKASLIFKHHPMNRGHVNYSAIIKSLSKHLNIKHRVIYVHDLALPEVYERSLGCITVNSTFGLQALSHGVPTIALGRCFYNHPGVTYQDSLDEFWSNPGSVDLNKIQSYRNYIISKTQVNGCLYSISYDIN